MNSWPWQTAQATTVHYGIVSCCEAILGGKRRARALQQAHITEKTTHKAKRLDRAFDVLTR